MAKSIFCYNKDKFWYNVEVFFLSNLIFLQIINSYFFYMNVFLYKSFINSRNIFSILFLLSFIIDMQGQITFEPQPGFFRHQRQMPLVSLPTTKDIYVTSFGAKTNDGKDDIKGIQAAIKAAIVASTESNPVRVVFDKGIYDVKPITGQSFCLFVTGAKNIVFDGNGAEIQNHNPRVGFFELKACTNVIFKNLYFDYAVLPFTQGLVTAVDVATNSFTLKISDGLPLLTDSQFTESPEKWGCLKDVTGKLKSGADNLFPYKGWEQISGNLFKVNTPTNNKYIKQVEIGDYFVQIGRNNGKTIFNTLISKNVTYLDITIYSSPAGSFSGQSNFELNIINCKVIPKPGTGRVQSGNADIVHISGSYLGPWVQGCHFEAFTDDAVNLKHAKRDVLEIVSPTVLRVLYNVVDTDKFVIFNPRDGVVLASNLNITNVIGLPENVFEVTFDGNHNVKETGLSQTADKIYLTNQASESFIFRNNKIKNGRRFGILLQSSYGQIKDCTFENLSSSGIAMENHLDWSEGFIANFIAITDNTFINCGFDTSYKNNPNAAAITTMVLKLKTPCAPTSKWCGVEPAQWQGLENIIITNNHFTYNKAAINLQNLNGGIINNNVFVHNPNDTTLNPGELPREVSNFNCSNLILDALGKKP